MRLKDFKKVMTPWARVSFVNQETYKYVEYNDNYTVVRIEVDKGMLEENAGITVYINK